MNDHPDAESLSSYIDDEVDIHQREAIDLHLASCAVCKADLDLLRRAGSAIARLEQVQVTPDEHRALRQAILSERPSIRRRAPLWGLVGVGAIVVAGAIGFINFQQMGERSTLGRTVRDAAVTNPVNFEFETDDQIRQVVTTQAEVAGGMERFTVADVGTHQESSIRQALAIRSSLGASKAARGRDDAAQETETNNGWSFDASSGELCIRKVLRSQPYPMIPLLARQAAFRQKPAWLLVYAFTPDSESTSRLDRAQIWLISPEDCSKLEGAGLINAAYHYSFYKKP